MSFYTARALEPVRVPELFWNSLAFAWPAQLDPSGMLGPGTLVGFGNNPKRYVALPANAPLQHQAFTITATVVISATPSVNAGYVFSTATASASAFRSGIALTINSGLATYYEINSASAGPFISASISTAVGVRHDFLITRQAGPNAFRALYRNGTLVQSVVGVGSWFTQNTFHLGWRGTAGQTSDTWSGYLSDVYVFQRVLTPAEISLFEVGIGGTVAGAADAGATGFGEGGFGEGGLGGA